MALLNNRMRTLIGSHKVRDTICQQVATFESVEELVSHDSVLVFSSERIG